MLDSKTLRQIIKEIFQFDDDFIVPISSNWFLPDINLDENPGTYIGYRILSKKNYSSDNKEDELKVSFRLTFVGENAEQMADRVHFWKDMKEVQKVFSKYKIQFNYSDLVSFTYPVRYNNCEMSWILDMSCYSDYLQDLKLINSDNKRLSVFKKLISKGVSK